MPASGPAEESWEIVRRFLPDNLETSAREHGAVRRARGEIRSAAVLLRLILLHAGAGLSLEQTVRRAREQKLVKISAVGLFKRLRAAGPWLAWLTGELMKGAARDWDGSSWGGRPVRLLDHADVEEPGPTGTELRLRYALGLPELSCDSMTLAPLGRDGRDERLPLAKSDIIVCGQCPGAVVTRILARQADVVMRLETADFPLEDEKGASLESTKLVARWKIGRAGEWPVMFVHEGRRRALRLCALRKSRAAAAQSRSEMVFVLTSLAADVAPAARVLELESVRWRVEPSLRRLRRLLSTGPVPKTTDASSRAWLQARIVTALLAERLELEGRLGSPWGYPLTRSIPPQTSIRLMLSSFRRFAP